MGTFGTILLLIIAFFLICGAITNFIAAAAKSAVPKTGKMTKVRGGEIHWVESGQGRPIVMIHGLGANLRNFTYALTGKLEAADGACQYGGSAPSGPVYVADTPFAAAVPGLTLPVAAVGGVLALVLGRRRLRAR